MSKKICSSCVAFILLIQRGKIIFIGFFTIVSKQNARARSPGCLNIKKIKFESNSALKDQTHSYFDDILISNHDSQS